MKKIFQDIFFSLQNYDFAIFILKIYAWLGSHYEQVKEFNDFQFNYFPFKSEKRETSFQYTMIIQVMTPVSIRPYNTELNQHLLHNRFIANQGDNRLPTENLIH